METTYTIFNKNSTKDYSSDELIDEAVDYLKDPESFRSFDEGLKQILIKKGFSGNDNNGYELANYLIEKLRSIDSTIEDATVLSWFIGTSPKGNKPRPKIEAGSRSKIYEICFSLNMTLQETVWFFEHVYYDRPFNCHTIEEAVFYYSFLHNIHYKEALQIISEIQNASTTNSSDSMDTNYTQFVQERIDGFTSINQLKEFLVNNKANFSTWNQSAHVALHSLVNRLIGPEESKVEIDSLKRSLQRKINFSAADFVNEINKYNNCGLLIREILYDSQHQTTDRPDRYILDAINNKNTRKNTFILERLLQTSAGLKKNGQIPYVVRNNFPSKKIMSDILSEGKISISKSYDSIRKVLILLDFYRFWVNIKLNGNEQGLSHEELSQTYRDEADDLLYNCGYNELYDGNPYDWIFLCAAQSNNPLEYFRACVGELLLENY